MTYLHDIDPIAFSLGPIKVHWYGIMYLLGFAAALEAASRRMEHEQAVKCEEAAVIVENEAKRVLGTYEYGCELFKKRMECAIMIKVAENQELAAKGIEVPIELGSTCNACADGEACE